MKTYTYGKCECCGGQLLPMRREVYELKTTNTGRLYRTGKVLSVVDYLFCEICGDQMLVDGTFDYEI